MKLKQGLLLVTGMILLAGCRTYPDYSSDFRFPILRGDTARGQQTFVELGCNRCHTVYDVELPAYSGVRPITVELGGELIFAKTYGALVTSIINPDHVISQRYLDQLPQTVRRATTGSPMPFFEDMTISQLVDVVAFLNANYRLLPGYTEFYY